MAINTFLSTISWYTLSQSERMKKVLHANRSQKKAGVAILVSDKINFKTKTVARDKEGHHTIIKGSIQEEYIINIYVSDIEATYIHKILSHTQREKLTVTNMYKN